MSKNKPNRLTKEEIKEIASIKDVQDFWGAESAEETEHVLATLYSVKLVL